MTSKDLIYVDSEYRIYKKGVDELGTYTPQDCLNLIDIALNQLVEWKGYKESAQEVIIKRVKKAFDI